MKSLHLVDVQGSPAISEPQRRRLYAIGRGKGLDTDEYRNWLLAASGYSSDKDICKAHYETIVTAVEAL